MKSYAYQKVNAFTSGSSKGNPAAYLLLGEDRLSHEEMLCVGKDHKGFVSEVVFCSNSIIADLKLTYYSSECEVDFCGHGTIAAMYNIIKANPQLRGKKEILIETNRKGTLTVYNRIEEEDVVYITAPKAINLEVPTRKDEIASALGVFDSDLSEEYPVDFIDAGLRTLIVPIGQFEKEISFYPEEGNLKKFCQDNGIDIILCFSLETGSPDYIGHTRVFAPKFGYLEDVATGSGNSAFANYLLKNKLWDGQGTAIEQGGDNILFNSINIMTQNEEILFGGRAAVVIDGFYNIVS